MTGMLGHPVAENPIDRMFDAVYAHYGLHWQFWKSDIADESDLAHAVAALRPLGYRGMAITVPYKVAVMPLLDEVDDDVRAIGAANYLTIEQGRLIGHNNDGKGVVRAIEKVAPLRGQRVVMLGAGGAGRAMAVEMAWAGAAHLTLVTRRESQGIEVAQRVRESAGVPCDWQPWTLPVAVPGLGRRVRRELVVDELVLVGQETVVAVVAAGDVDDQVPALHEASPSHFSIWIRQELLDIAWDVGVIVRMLVRMLTHPAMSVDAPGSPCGR